MIKPLSEDLGFVDEWGKDNAASLSKKVDEAGGWNPEAVCVQFFHGERRYCIFSSQDVNSGWWTTVLTRDEYYWEKITPRFKADRRREIVQDIKRQIQ